MFNITAKLYHISMNERITVIFDFDGTLANTIELVARIYNEHHEEFGSLPVDLEELPIYQKLGYKKAAKKAKIRWRKIPKLMLTIGREMKKHMGEVDPYPGVVQMLKKIRAKGISIGVLTSNNGSLVKEFFKVNDFPEFDFIVSEKTLFGKEKSLKKIIKRHNLDRNKVIYVGDEPRDVVSCRKAKIKVIGVTWGLGGVEGLAPSNPDKIVHNTSELFNEIIKYNDILQVS
jgi:phosphoglycolate phosphatase